MGLIAGVLATLVSPVLFEYLAEKDSMRKTKSCP